jgi:serine O-acetyltransferase
VDVPNPLSFSETAQPLCAAADEPRGDGIAAATHAAQPARRKPKPVAKDPDWSREEPRRGWDPGRSLLRTIRAYQATAHWWWPLRKFVRAFIVARHRFWSAVSGADVPLNAQLSGGVILPHPTGVVIHPKAVIGPNCVIFQQVTIGRRAWERVAPVIGAGVEIGAGAKILGRVTIGDGAKIGANAVVLRDVPAGCTAVGIPARIIGVDSTSPAGGGAGAVVEQHAPLQALEGDDDPVARIGWLVAQLRDEIDESWRVPSPGGEPQERLVRRERVDQGRRLRVQ